MSIRQIARDTLIHHTKTAAELHYILERLCEHKGAAHPGFVAVWIAETRDEIKRRKLAMREVCR